MSATVRTTTSVPLSERGVLRMREACQYLGFSRSRIYELIAEGRIQSVKIGGARRVIRESCDRLIAESAA